MPRPKTRTDHLLPHFASRLQQWGLSKRAARRLLGLGDLTDQDIWRILRGDDATPAEVRRISRAIRQYGSKHNLPGWQDLDEGD